MQLILLSGGSGKRLWPLSNDSYSKQFLRLLPSPDGGRESMVQRVVRQIKESGIKAEITIATGENQRDAITSQLGGEINVVTEPERRDTFPAIALACLYLEMEKKCSPDEVVVVMPCDPYTDAEYFATIGKMALAVEKGSAELVLMGICPDYPSVKYGYIIPEQAEGEILRVRNFTEKPDIELAKNLIAEGAFWNGGVFAFRLGYLLEIARSFTKAGNFREAKTGYSRFPTISFDYQVAEKAESVAVVPFKGMWRDIGTWDALSEVIGSNVIGNAVIDEHTKNTHIINQLDIPCICIGANNLVIAASPDGILIVDKYNCEQVKPYVSAFEVRPMYEERRWGTYKVIDNFTSSDSTRSLTKHLCIAAGKSISYQRHFHRDEVWTFVEGSGVLVLDGAVRNVGKGDVVHITKGQMHAIKAVTDLHILEVQMGDLLDESDIERFEYNWE